MSVFNDFQEAWTRRFPGHTLPKAWEDDVRANLSKHRQRVSLLREELDKEQFYVEYLESLLNDVERIKYIQKQTSQEGAEAISSSSNKNGHHKGSGNEADAGPGEYVTIINVNNNSESEKYGEIQKPLTSIRDNYNRGGGYGLPPPKEPKDIKKLIDNPLYQDAQSLSLEVASRSSQSTTRETTPDDDSIIETREVKPQAPAVISEKSHPKRGSLDSTGDKNKEASLPQERRHSESGPIVKDAHLKKKSSIDSTSSSSSSGSAPSVKPSHSVSAANDNQKSTKVIASTFSQAPKPTVRNQTEVSKPAANKFSKPKVNENNSNDANNADSKRRPPTPPRKPKINELVMHFQRMGSTEPESHGPSKPSASKGISSPLIGPHDKKTKVQISSAKENGFSFNQENRGKNQSPASDLDADDRKSQEPRSTTSTPNSLSSLPTTPDAEDVLNSLHGGRHLLLQKSRGAAKISDLSPQDANEETKSMASVTLTGATDDMSVAETLKNDLSELIDPDDDIEGDIDMDESLDSEQFARKLAANNCLKKAPTDMLGASQDEIYDDSNIYDTVAPDEEDEHHTNEHGRKQRQHIHHHGSQRPAPYIGTPTSTIDDHEAMFLDSDSIHGADKNSSTSNLSVSGKGGNHLQAGGHSYANYVNIDYFLRREETSSKDDSDDNETHFSQSISSDHDLEDVQGLPPSGISKMGSCSSMPPQLPQPKLRRSRDQLKGSANDLASSQNRSASSTMSKGSGGRQREPIDSNATYDEVFEPQAYNPTLVTYDSVTDLQDEANSVEAGPNEKNKSKELLPRSAHRPIMNEAEEKIEAERIMMYRCIIASIVESETVYVDCLNTLLQYMKALKSTIGTTHPLLTAEDLNTIFYKIPDLHAIHCQFLEGIKKLQDLSNRSATLPTNSDNGTTPLSSYNTASSDNVGSNDALTLSDLFKVLASRLGAYSAYLKNYSKALETVHRCSAENNQFAEIARSITLKSMNKQVTTLDELLHKPVARVQKNALILHDLLKYTPESHSEYKSLKTALKMTQCFLNDLNIAATEQLFPLTDKTQRRLVKESFIVDATDGKRKLRHLFLFNDVLVCAKYKSAPKQKFTFDLKWYLMLGEMTVADPETPAEGSSNPAAKQTKDTKDASSEILSLKSKLGSLRETIKKELRASSDKTKTTSRVLEKLRKRKAEFEATLVLLLPSLPMPITQTKTNKTYLLYLSSDFERTSWIESIRTLQQQSASSTANSNCDPINFNELQAWIETCRKTLKPSLGSWCLRSNKDEELLYGDLYFRVDTLRGLSRPADIFFTIEVDTYGHFVQRAMTRVSRGTAEPTFDQEFVLDLDGSKNIRILCYEEIPGGSTKPLLRGRTNLELSRSWLKDIWMDKEITILDSILHVGMRYVSTESSTTQIPTAKICGAFGLNVQQVCKKEKSNIPYLVQCCVREVERRGMKEVGIYRVSGLSSDIQKLKKSFESNAFEAEQLLKEIDIHAVTGLLKMYLRELPEALFTNMLYKKFFDAFNVQDKEEKKRKLVTLYSGLPPVNKSVITFLIEHLVKVNEYESHNKMSLHNLATVFGPTMIRSGASSTQNQNTSAESFTAGTIDVMAQAGILHFFLSRQHLGEPLESLEPSDQ